MSEEKIVGYEDGCPIYHSIENDRYSHFYKIKNGHHVLHDFEGKPGSTDLIDGTVHYFKDGKMHRDNGLPAIIGENVLCYLVNGKYHRLDGPAYYSFGETIYYVNDIVHRIDGPAYKSSFTTFYIVNGINLTDKFNILNDEDFFNYLNAQIMD